MKAVLKLSLALFGLLMAIPAALSAKPAPPADHPAYLHALTDLRTARAHLQRPDGGELRDQEKKAIHEIDEAINEIKKASIDDGKDLNDHPPVDTHMAWDGRLHRALQLLDKAHQDISQRRRQPLSRKACRNARSCTSIRPITTLKKPSTWSTSVVSRGVILEGRGTSRPSSISRPQLEGSWKLILRQSCLH